MRIPSPLINSRCKSGRLLAIQISDKCVRGQSVATPIDSYLNPLLPTFPNRLHLGNTLDIKSSHTACKVLSSSTVCVWILSNNHKCSKCQSKRGTFENSIDVLEKLNSHTYNGQKSVSIGSETRGNENTFDSCLRIKESIKIIWVEVTKVDCQCPIKNLARKSMCCLIHINGTDNH